MVPDCPHLGSENARGWYSRGYLQHHDLPGAETMFTFREHDSVPTRLLRAYARVLEAASEGDRLGARARILSHRERYLGKGKGPCRLRDPRAARIVEDTVRFYAPHDYDLIAWVVMPNHVHVIIRRKAHAPHSLIVRRWKSWTARKINEIRGESGPVWQREVFDQWLRSSDDEHAVMSAIRYVELNPVEAGLCKRPVDWEFSSARWFPERWGGDRRE